jgi:hypothetical protein
MGQIVNVVYLLLPRISNQTNLTIFYEIRYLLDIKNNLIPYNLIYYLMYLVVDAVIQTVRPIRSKMPPLSLSVCQEEGKDAAYMLLESLQPCILFCGQL